MKTKLYPPTPRRIVITATDARQDLYHLLHRVHYDRHIFLIKKHGKVIAEIRGVNYRKYTPPLERATDWSDELAPLDKLETTSVADNYQSSTALKP